MTPAIPSLRTHCLSPSRLRPPIDAAIGPHGYGRMFPDLPAFDADEAFLHAIGREGGLCDCGDSADTPESLGSVAAGWPIFGQFVAHDITADRSAPQAHVECLYGDGPVGQPFLYRRDDPAELLLGANDADVPRNAEGIAIVGDPRNDSHMLMAQMHLAMLKVHNAFVDDARQAGVAEPRVFETAVTETQWHYQTIVLNEFLPSLVGQPLVDQVAAEGPRWFRPSSDVFIPLEFADGAYRYGHCQIRHQYELNSTAPPAAIFPDLLGFRPVPANRTVDWTRFFDAEGALPAQRAKKIDGRLVRSLIQLPVAITGECEIDEYHSLAVRDLQRGQGVGLPSGEAVARRMGVKPLSREDVGLGAAGWTGETPLWYYILREAATVGSANRLGPVGGRIVAEVMMTILDRDPTSVRNAGRGWRPRGSLVDLFVRRAPIAAA